MSTKKRHFISNSDLRDLIEDLKPNFGAEVEELLDNRVETAELESGEEIILVDGEPVLVKEDEEFFPLIQAVEKLNLKSVIVDMGAVEPITDGADIMAPGVVEVEEDIQPGGMVCIQDEENHKTIAIGRALEESSQLTGEEGKVIENLHYVGDEFWSILEEF